MAKCTKCGKPIRNNRSICTYCDGYICGIEKGRADAIEFISDKLIYPLLDEYDRGLWEHINYIKLAKEWIKVLDDNPYLKVKNHTEARKRDLRQWIAEQLKAGEKNE